MESFAQAFPVRKINPSFLPSQSEGMTLGQMAPITPLLKDFEKNGAPARELIFLLQDAEEPERMELMVMKILRGEVLGRI